MMRGDLGLGWSWVHSLSLLTPLLFLSMESMAESCATGMLEEEEL